jgi:type VI secretion system protein ImpJ
MGWQNRVVWSEGLFLQPQHFQQHERYLERLIDSRSAPLRAYGYGFTKLTLNEELLALGKVAISAASGLMPDGTPFDFPAWQDPPTALEVAEGTKDQRVLLTLPARRAETVEIENNPSTESLARFAITEYEAPDTNSSSDEAALMQVGTLRMRLALESETLGPYVHLGVVHIRERRADGRIVLDGGYVPPLLDNQVSAVLMAFSEDVLGMLHQKGEALAKHVSGIVRGAVAEVTDFLFLQVINRYEPLFAHFTRMVGLHPETLYQATAQLAGELATFGDTRRPNAYPIYQHDNLRLNFEPLLGDLRRLLSATTIQRAIEIPIEVKKFGYHIAMLADKTLLDDASFVLAVKANVRTDELVSGFPAQTTVAPGERIKAMVDGHLPGIDLRLLPVAPRHIPFHAGYSYFDLDRGHALWKELAKSGGFAMHVAGKFPGLEMEFWAIRE